MPILDDAAAPPHRLALRAATPSSRTRCLIGAFLGLAFFLLVGLVPSLLVGGSAGTQVASLVGDAWQAPAIGLRTLAILGVVGSAAIGAATFASLGAALAAAVGQLSGDTVARPRSR